jgi:phosphoesterase RecJ-like protein
MKLNDHIKQFGELIAKSNKVLIIQADNPDGDSLGSSLALEQILGDLNKETYLYCRIDIPNHLKYLSGWDRVDKELPKEFDLSILVDCSSRSLLESMDKNGDLSKIMTKPFIVIDHHGKSENPIEFVTLQINESVPATGELIYIIAKELDYKINKEAASALAVAIMSDTLGLVSQSTTSDTIRTMADLVDLGVDLTFLDEARRNLNRKSPELIKYKGELLQRIEFYDDNAISIIVIPWEEIKKYSNSYNPSVLVMDDMRLGDGTRIAIAFKCYQNGRITAKIRSNYDAPIAAKLAEKFGGGGHKHASGFKIDNIQNASIMDIKNQTIAYTIKLLDEIDK